ncbi:DNRLRE domain-containing protein [Antribacter sp. KLBMP9083]|uniref:DNRLRE domain-containing protein n=1 Tax=Antribacter soli TaxID=2910976 RepID=A0AA41QKC8_9MICO|nr:DNRLRE domain-containing protein [Antribacter soli]MCF4123654.1 DNRLRE domain-containing protein [Antribacter soli]MCF4123677.1 DNRLRE domain-containing protein [Antribacter soli]
MSPERAGVQVMTVLVSFAGVPGSWRRGVAVVAFVAAVAVTGGVLVVPAAVAVPMPVAEAVPVEIPAERTEGGYLWAPDIASATVIAGLEDEPVEVLGERTPSSSTYVMPSGVMAFQSTSGPVWVPTGDGDGTALADWAQTDLTLATAGDGTVRPVAQIGDLTLSGGGQPGESGTIDVARLTDPESGVVSVLAWPGVLPAPRLEGRRAVYASVAEGVDLVVEASMTSFRHYLVAADAAASARAGQVALTYRAEGGAIHVEEDGTLAVQTPAGEVVSRTGAPAAWDATADAARVAPVTTGWVDEAPVRGFRPLPSESELLGAGAGSAAGSQEAVSAEPSTESDVVSPSDPTSESSTNEPVTGPVSDEVPLSSVVEQIDTGSVEMRLDGVEELAADPSTDFPLIVDPSMYLAWDTVDTYVQSDSTVDKASEGELRIGTFNGGGVKARAFVNFDTRAVAGARILSAQLELFNFYSSTCTATEWNVYHTGSVNSGTRWGAQPEWISHQRAVSSAAGYSAGCPGGWVRPDVTGAIQWTADRSYSTMTFGLRATNESDSLTWKRFYSTDFGSYVPAVIGAYQHPPALPTNLKALPSEAGVNMSPVSSATPQLSAVIDDPNGEFITATFQVNTPTGVNVANYTASVDTTPSDVDVTAQVTVAQGVLAEGGTYAFRVKASDGVLESAWTDWYWMVVDTITPGAPVVSSTDYPGDGTWHKNANEAGTFSFSMNTPDSTVVAYRWGLDKAPEAQNTVGVSQGAAGTASITPTTVGPHVLQVVAVDGAGHVSQVARYAFQVGRAGIVAPVEGARVVRRVRVEVGTNDTTLTHLKLQWRRGPDAAVVEDVPAAALNTSSGGPVGSGLVARSGLGSYVSWDAVATVGAAGGPVQVRALLDTAADGIDAVATQWVTLTVDPDASGATTTQIGPGSVNLLTGDHTLSVTDVEEFGLSVVRTASSRDTDSGFQLQDDKLSETQRKASTLTDVQNGTATVAVDTGRFHEGGTSFKVAPNGSGIADSYAHVGGAEGALRLGLAGGRTYRVSGWVYVPAATGLSPVNPRGQRVAVFWKKDGAYNEPLTTGSATPAPTSTDMWQQVSVDVTIPDGVSEAFVRLYNGNSDPGKVVYFDDLSVRQIWAPFGKQWATGTVDAAAGTAYTKVTMPNPDVAAVHMTGGGEVWFSRGGQAWYPEPGAEALKLTQPSADTWRLTEIDGTVTDFVRNGTAGDFVVTTTAPPAASGQSRHVYAPGPDGVQRLARVIAPIETGVDGWPGNTSACTTATPARGCEVLELKYAPSTTATGSAPGLFSGQVESASIWSWDGTAMTKVTVAEYRYDTSGRLVEVYDPRIEQAGGTRQVTRYGYDGAGRITTVTASGEEPYTFTYGPGGASQTGSGDLVDPAPGRLLKVSRASLVPGTADQLGPVNTTTLVYSVPLTRGAGGPYNLDAATTAGWAQQDGPTDATAVFGPETDPSVTTASATVPGANGYGSATVHYLNAAGWEVNTASPAGTGAPADGFIDTAEYDRHGNTVRTLDATNRLLALGTLPGATEMLTELGLIGNDTVTRATRLDSQSRYSTDGLDLLVTIGPAQRLADAANPSATVLLRPRTTNVYDEGKPDGLAYHFVTTSTTDGVGIIDPVTGEGINPFAGQGVDPLVTKTGFDPLEPGGTALGATSGWVHKGATSVTIDAGQPTALTSTIVYDDKGRAVKSSKPGSTGSDAGTVHTVFWTAGANPDDTTCGNTPEYAGQPCVTKPGGDVTGHDPARMSAELATKRVDSYNRYGNPTVVSDNLGTIKRTTTTTYDAADRVTSVEITGTGPGAGEAIAKTTTAYDPATGDVVENASVNASGEPIQISKEYDRLGRLTKYTDSAGGWTTTTYDRYGQPLTVTNSTGASTTFEYNRTVEPRGLVTKQTDSVAGDIVPTWGPDGQLESQTLPGGVKLTIGYDAARIPVKRSYTRVSDGAPITSDSVVENQRGQVIQHAWSAAGNTYGEATYTYDRLGRLVRADDSSPQISTCTTRAYGYDTHTNRTSLTSATTAGGQACPGAGVATAAGATTVSSTYDSADRLVTTTGAGGNLWAYDAFGRITSMPATDTTGQTVAATSTYYLNDLVRRQEVPGVERTTWGLDPVMRHATQVDSTLLNEEWVDGIEKVFHFDGDSDEPAWVAEGATTVTRYVEGLDGALAVQTSGTGDRVLQLVDLHGDVIATLPIADNATEASWTQVRVQSFDEFGASEPMTSSGPLSDEDSRYGWLGGAQRNADTPTGTILMGVRVYHPATGRFLQVDPVAGGSANTYDYCNADPVNCIDLAGTAAPGWLTGLATIASVAAFIPGPIGMVAAGVSAVAYAASGDTKMALLMTVGIAAAAVGAGGAVVGAAAAVRGTAAAAKYVGPAIKAGARLARSVPKAVRGAKDLVVRASGAVARAATSSVRAIKYYASPGPRGWLFGNKGLGAPKPGRLNNAPKNSGKPALGWSVKGIDGAYYQQFRFKSRSGIHYDLFRGRRLN